MRRLWLLAIRNWSASPGRVGASLISVALGVATVVLITSFHETARHAVIKEVMHRWFGHAHLSIHPPGAHWGSFDASLASEVSQLPNVRHVTARLKRRARLIRADQIDQLAHSEWRSVDAIGIDPSTQYNFQTIPDVEGRMIQPGDRGVAVIDRRIIYYGGTSLGDDIFLTPRRGGSPLELRVVGIHTVEHTAGFQRPSVYLAIDDARQLLNEPSVATAIDIMLEDSSPEALAATQAALEQLIAQSDKPYQYQIESAAGRRKLFDEAERIARLLLVLAAFVAMLTSFFIILTTMSISLFERRVQLGIMRCVGLTRTQLSSMLFIELLPLGLFGTAVGLLLGATVARLMLEKLGLGPNVRLSMWGMQLAAASGIITTLVSASALVFQVCRVTPLTAVHPQALPARSRHAFISAGVGVVLLLVHEAIVQQADQTRWLGAMFASAGVGTLYLGYVLVTPAIVVLIGPSIARVVGPMLGLRGKLVEDQFVRTPWRSTAVCWVLMVGLSLIVYMGVGAESIVAVWDFPSRLPEGFVWSRQYASGETVERVRELPGVSKVTALADIDCEISTPDAPPQSATDALMKKFIGMFTRPVFVAADISDLLGMVKVTLIEGSMEDAKGKLERGGYVLIPVQTSRGKNLHMGDRVTIEIQGRSAEFEIAGVIQSPALDLTATAFQAHSYMQYAAASVVLGTHRDMKEKFGLHIASLVLCNLDLPGAEPPPDFDLTDLPEIDDNQAIAGAVLRWREHLPHEHDVLTRIGPQLEAWVDAGDDARLPTGVAAELTRFAKALRTVHWRRDRLSPDEAWTLFRERLILWKIAQTMDRPDAMIGSLRRVKSFFDRAMRHALRVLTYLPSIAFTVAVLGIANLMMVSVHLRSRQIAVLRAVGAVKSQIVRMVLAEAVVLGLLGSVMGVALGIHEAYTDNRVTGELIGFYPEFIIPMGTVVIGTAVTVGTCLLAGILPARYAARNNIIAAMQTT